MRCALHCMSDILVGLYEYCVGSVMLLSNCLWTVLLHYIIVQGGKAVPGTVFFFLHTPARLTGAVYLCAQVISYMGVFASVSSSMDGPRLTTSI